MGYIHFVNNPLMKNVGDCAIRAVSVVMDFGWDDAYKQLCIQGFCMGDLPNSDAVVGAFLFLNGFERQNIETICPDCYTIKDFSMEHPRGVYLIGTGTHMVGMIDGDYFDTFDSGYEIPVYVWKKGER